MKFRSRTRVIDWFHNSWKVAKFPANLIHGITGTKAFARNDSLVANLKSQLGDSQDLGRKLMEHIIDCAQKELAPIDLHLTSNPQRVSANALYKAVGFEQRETNVYRMVIK